MADNLLCFFLFFYIILFVLFHSNGFRVFSAIEIENEDYHWFYSRKSDLHSYCASFLVGISWEISTYRQDKLQSTLIMGQLNRGFSKERKLLWGVIFKRFLRFFGGFWSLVCSCNHLICLKFWKKCVQNRLNKAIKLVFTLFSVLRS